VGAALVKHHVAKNQRMNIRGIMIKKVRIVPGCISCGSCEAICSAVFKVEGTAHIHNHDAVADHEDEINEAAEMCPVSVIEVTNEED